MSRYRGDNLDLRPLSLLYPAANFVALPTLLSILLFLMPYFEFIILKIRKQNIILGCQLLDRISEFFFSIDPEFALEGYIEAILCKQKMSEFFTSHSVPYFPKI